MAKKTIIQVKDVEIKSYLGENGNICGNKKTWQQTSTQ